MVGPGILLFLKNVLTAPFHIVGLPEWLDPLPSQPAWYSIREVQYVDSFHNCHCGTFLFISSSLGIQTSSLFFLRPA
jgi:hypothetical protein